MPTRSFVMALAMIAAPGCARIAIDSGDVFALVTLSGSNVEVPLGLSASSGIMTGSGFVRAADVNGDAAPDLIAGDRSPERIVLHVALGIGGGRFADGRVALDEPGEIDAIEVGLVDEGTLSGQDRRNIR